MLDTDTAYTNTMLRQNSCNILSDETTISLSAIHCAFIFHCLQFMTPVCFKFCVLLKLIYNGMSELCFHFHKFQFHSSFVYDIAVTIFKQSWISFF